MDYSALRNAETSARLARATQGQELADARTRADYPADAAAHLYRAHRAGAVAEAYEAVVAAYHALQEAEALVDAAWAR